MTPEYGYGDDPEHRTIYPGRRCAVANASCKGMIQITFGGAQLCTHHLFKWQEADYAAVVERLREWVRGERKS